MQIKKFGMNAPRAEQMFQRILADIERRAPLPALDLRLHKTSMRAGSGPNTEFIPTLTCHVGESEAFHAAILDQDPSKEELTVLLTHTNGSTLGFKTTYEVKPQAAVFVSFDILQFFFERAEHLNVPLEGGEEGEYAPNPLFRKKLEVENALKAAYPELPQEYTWKANIEAQKPDNQPIVGGFQ